MKLENNDVEEELMQRWMKPVSRELPLNSLSKKISDFCKFSDREVILMVDEVDKTCAGIEGMLQAYEADHHTGMDVRKIAELIYEYTSGYPYMVSYICKKVDEEITGSRKFPDRAAAWTKEGILEAVKLLVKGPNTLYDDMIKHVAEYPDLYVKC